MPRCTVCNHPQHLEINQAILSGDLILADLSRKYGLSSSALGRHKNHIEVTMSRTRRRLREVREQGSVFLLNDILEQVRRNIAAAEAQGDYNAVFRGSHVASRLIYQLSRLEGTMKLDTLHRLISSPAWTPQAGLLPTDPKLMTDLHQALLDGAFVPCPEPATEISDDSVGRDPQGGDSPSAAPPAFRETAALSDVAPTQNSKLDTQMATLRQLQKLLPDLDLTLADISPEADLEAGNQREISGKAAANARCRTNNSQQNHKDTPSEKNLPKNPACTPQTTAPAAISVTDSPPANAANVRRESTRKGGEAQAPPAFGEADTTAAMPATDAPSAIVPVIAPSHLPSPETASYKPQTVFSPPPAFPEPAAAAITAPPAVSGISSDAYTPTPETVSRKPKIVFATPPALLDTATPDDPQVLDLSQEILDESLAAELAAYLAEFPPYARPAQDPQSDPCLSNPSSLIPIPCPSDACPAAPPPPDANEPGLHIRTGDELFLMTHGYPRDNPPKNIPDRHRDDLNFGNPGLFRSMKGNFM